MHAPFSIILWKTTSCLLACPALTPSAAEDIFVNKLDNTWIASHVSKLKSLTWEFPFWKHSQSYQGHVDGMPAAFSIFARN